MSIGYLWSISILARKQQIELELMRLSREMNDIKTSYGVLTDDGYISAREIPQVKMKYMSSVFGIAEATFNHGIMVANEKTGRVYNFRAATGYAMEQITQTMGATYTQCLKEAMREYAADHVKALAADAELNIQMKMTELQQELKILENQEKLADKTAQESHQRMGKVMA